jgi:hypothetical protein
MNPTQANETKYYHLIAWEKAFGSLEYYLKSQLAKARADNAHETACYYSQDERRWICCADLSADTRLTIEELVRSLKDTQKRFAEQVEAGKQASTKRKAKTFAEKLGLTDEEYRKLKSAVGRTWNYIAGDIFQNLASEGVSKMRRSEVIEVTLDADRVRSMNPELPESVKNLLKSYDAKTYNILKQALKTDVFTHAFYCA